MTDKVIEKIAKFFEKASKETGADQEKIQVSIKNADGKIVYRMLNEYIPVREINLHNDILEIKKHFDFFGLGAICEMVISKNFEKYAKRFESDVDKISFVIFKKESRFLVFVYCGNQVKMLSEHYNSLPIEEFVSIGVPLNI